MATLEEILEPIRCLLADHERQMASVRMAIEYEAASAIPDEAQLGYLYEKLDTMQSASLEADELMCRVRDREIVSAIDLQAEVRRIIGPEPNAWAVFLQRIGLAIKDALGKIARAFVKMWEKLKVGMRNAWGALRRFLGPRKRPLSRRKRPGLATPLEPLPLAPEQAPGASSGAIRGEVRYYRRFL